MNQSQGSGKDWSVGYDLVKKKLLVKRASGTPFSLSPHRCGNRFVIPANSKHALATSCAIPETALRKSISRTFSNNSTKTGEIIKQKWEWGTFRSIYHCCCIFFCLVGRVWFPRFRRGMLKAAQAFPIT